MRGPLDWMLDRRDRNIRASRNVLRQQLAIIHFVDVIAGEHQHVFGSIELNHRQIMKYGIGRSSIPFATGWRKTIKRLLTPR